MSYEASPARQLVARTRAIAVPDDLLEALGPGGFAWLRDGQGFVTSGVAARVRADRADELLARIDAEDGDPPIAVGALPFDDPGSGELVVPAQLVGLGPDGAWVTEVSPRGAPPLPLEPAAERGLEPGKFVVRRSSDPDEWAAAVEAILAAIGRGELEKAVLARQATVEANRPFDLHRILDRLRARQAGCFVYADGGFVGASPELLVARNGDQAISRPMAGTVARGATESDDARRVEALARSAKDAWEHRVVVDAVTAALALHCTDVQAGAEPEIARLATVSHLVTTITGTVADGSSALALACSLHPTPAVGGTPTGTALALLRELEGFDRDRYAGPVGWVDASGDGQWAVGLRSARIDGATATLTAGAGIVDGSEPTSEWAETQAKLEPMLQALIRP
ncbi:MAG: dhbC [Actinomycetia bacterium]|nr:dhbC [Actinomycetes bacterium]